MNRNFNRLLVAAAAFATFAGALFAQQTAPATTTKQYVFPNKGQSSEQQKKDVADCEAWATTETGFDPTKPIVHETPAPPPQGSTGRSMVRGAAAGYIIGDIANDEGGEGAAIGAAVGAVSGSRRKRQGQQAQAADQQAFEQQVAAMKNEHTKARAVCLEAKGYTVK